MTPAGFSIPRPGKLYNIVNARFRPAPIDVAQVSQVLAAYDLGRLKDYKQPAIGPSRSRNLVVHLSDGPKILKQYKPSMTLEGITYEHSVLQHLAINDFPSPRLISSKEGKTCLEIEGKQYALFDFVPGFRYVDYFFPAQCTRFFLTEAGKTLARYHQIVDGFVPAGQKLDGYTPDGKQRWRDQNWYLDIFAKAEMLFKAKGEKSELDRFFLENLGRLKQWYVDLDHAVAAYSALLPKLVTHGDYGPYNLLFNDEALAAVLDFECVHLELRATELIKALARFADRGVGLDYDRAKIFLRAYTSVCPLAVREIELMPHLSRLQRLRVLAYQLRAHLNSASPLTLRDARESIAGMNWMNKNGNELVEVLMECRKHHETSQ